MFSKLALFLAAITLITVASGPGTVLLLYRVAVMGIPVRDRSATRKGNQRSNAAFNLVCSGWYFLIMSVVGWDSSPQ